MPAKICPICRNVSEPRLKKGDIQYNQCTNCKTLYSDPLENADMVGGGNEVERNVQQNHLRIERVAEIARSMRVEEPKILDFGCGHGMLVDDFKKAGYDAEGFDVYNEMYAALPERGKYDIITAIEVIEHTSSPFIEIDVIHRSLKNGGVVYIETSFIDIAAQENIALEDFFYIAPEVGHSTIFSFHGLDLLMTQRNFSVLSHFNRNAKIYQKLK